MHVPIPTLTLFAQVNSNHPRLVDYLIEQREKVRANLGRADKNPLIFRAQGDLARLDELIELLQTSNGHLQKLKP